MLIPKPKERPVFKYIGKQEFSPITQNNVIVFHTNGDIIFNAKVGFDVSKAEIVSCEYKYENALLVMNLAEKSQTLLKDTGCETNTEIGKVHKFTMGSFDIWLKKEYIFSDKIKLYAGKSDRVPVRIVLDNETVGAVASVLMPSDEKYVIQQNKFLLEDRI